MNKKFITAIYPGTFDPVHLGHIDVVKTVANLFDRVIWAIGVNSTKKPMFSTEDRIKMLSMSLPSSNIEIATFSGLLVNFALEYNAGIIIRSIRTNSDFEFEFQMALINRKLAEHIATIFIPAQQNHLDLSSTVIRELISYHQKLEGYIPKNIAEFIKNL